MMMRIVWMSLIMVALTGMLSAEGIVADKSERDLICGLQPYKNPKWVTEIELRNGKKLHFISVKCMMLFYFKNDKWDDLGLLGTKDPIVALRIQDFNSLKVVDAKKAYYVYGSHIMSSKGDDLVPFEYEKDAENFMKENGGRKILTWKDFKLNLFDLLNL